MAKKNRYFQDALSETLGDIGDTIIHKQIDYGPNALTRFGIDGIVIRMHDNIERLTNLVRMKQTPEVEESIEDTLFDIAGYAILGKMMADGEFPLPMKQKDGV